MERESGPGQGPIPVPAPVGIQHAANETSAWRNFMVSISGGNPGNIINGYYIPIADINAIVEGAKNLGYTIRAIRAYFALRNTGISAGENVHLYVVAVDDATGNDIYITPNGISMVYDTTMPCPSMCGGGNPLNGG